MSLFNRWLLATILLIVTVFFASMIQAGEGKTTTYNINELMDTRGSSAPASYTLYNDNLYFSASDSQHGRELWMYNGQEKKVSLVKDIVTGSIGAITGDYQDEQGINDYQAMDMQVYDDKLYFGADDTLHGLELWAYDSRTDKAALVLDINSGNYASAPNNFTVYNDKLYFAAYDSDFRRQLWVFDSVTNKANKITDITEDRNELTNFTIYNNRLYFTHGKDYEQFGQLWVYDNLSNTISVINDEITIRELTVYDNKLYFPGNNESYQGKLYSYDSTTGEVQVRAELAGYDYTVYRDQLYFLNYQETPLRSHLWRFNAYTSALENIIDADFSYCGDYGCIPGALNVYQDKLYFNGYADNRAQLISYNTEKFIVVDEMPSGAIYQGAPKFTPYQDKLFFTARSWTQGWEGWFYDVNSKKVELLYDELQVSGSSPLYLTPYGDKLYFSATDGISGNELWAYDPSSNSPHLVVDIKSNIDQPWKSGSSPTELTVYQNKLYFSADDGIHGKELWVYDVEGETASLVKDLVPGEQNSNPEHLQVYLDQLCFIAQGTQEDTHLWCYNSADGGSFQAIFSAPYIDNTRLTVFNNQLLFSYFSYNQEDQLLAYDSTTGITEILAEGGHSGSYRVEYNGKLYFQLASNELGYYDPQTGSVHSAFKLEEGSIKQIKPVVYHNKLYYVASAPGSMQNLWAYDSNSDINERITDNYKLSSNTYLDQLSVYQEKLYFGNSDGNNGRELWFYDSNTGTTALASDILAGPHSSNAYLTTVFHGALWGGAETGYNETTDAFELVKFELYSLDTIEIKASASQGNEGERITLTLEHLPAEQEQLSYTWQQIGGSKPLNFDTSSATITITLPAVDADEGYSLEVTISDGNDSTTATVNFTILKSEDNTPTDEPAEESSSGGSMGWLITCLLLIQGRRFCSCKLFNGKI